MILIFLNWLQQCWRSVKIVDCVLEILFDNKLPGIDWKQTEGRTSETYEVLRNDVKYVGLSTGNMGSF